jgi:hypothetical protein
MTHLMSVGVIGTAIGATVPSGRRPPNDRYPPHPAVHLGVPERRVCVAQRTITEEDLVGSSAPDLDRSKANNAKSVYGCYNERS